jgi:hypothetical protein
MVHYTDAATRWDWMGGAWSLVVSCRLPHPILVCMGVPTKSQHPNVPFRTFISAEEHHSSRVLSECLVVTSTRQNCIRGLTRRTGPIIGSDRQIRKKELWDKDVWELGQKIPADIRVKDPLIQQPP